MSTIAPLRGLSTALLLSAALPLAGAQTTFVDIAPASGLDLWNLGRGAAMVDLDLDGHLDIICSSEKGVASTGDHYFYQRQADGTYIDRTSDWGVLPNDMPTWGLLVADFDEDGDPDVYMVNGGYTQNKPNQMLRNDLGTSGQFTDVSNQGNDVNVATNAFGGAAFDYDRDGDLDIFMGNNAVGGPQLNTLIRNDGGLSFTEVTAAAGMTQLGIHRHCGAGDYDNDGWPDVGVANFAGPNRLYRNLADGTFEEVAAAAGVESPTINFGFNFADFDNDGWLDIFLPKWQPEDIIKPSTFLLNNHDGTFTDVTPGMNTGYTTDMGHNVADVDADGHPDVFIGTGWPAEAHDDILYLVQPDGQGGLTATNDSLASGILANGPTRCHGVTFGDIDDDGDIDIYLNHGGMSHGADAAENNVLWENQGNGRKWVAVDLSGVLSPNTPAGAKTTVTTDTGRQVHRLFSVGSGFSNTDAYTQHIGLGDDSGALRLVVRWPSGITQTVISPPVEQRFDLIETGLRIEGSPGPGAPLSLEACGPPLEVVELFFGLVPLNLQKPAFGGILGVAPPFVGPIPIPLDGAGLHASTPVLPNDPGLSGFTLYTQAWVHPAGVSPGGTLTNVVELIFP